jgi:hypothetical protein
MVQRREQGPCIGSGSSSVVVGAEVARTSVRSKDTSWLALMSDPVW